MISSVSVLGVRMVVGCDCVSVGGEDVGVVSGVSADLDKGGGRGEHKEEGMVRERQS